MTLFEVFISGALVADLSLSVVALFHLRITIRDERERSDRYAAAALHVASEGKAATTVAPPERPASAPADGRTRARQEGLSPRR